MSIKFVCINDTLENFNSNGDYYQYKDPFLVIGKTYETPFYGPLHNRIVIMFSDGNGNWLSYTNFNFISLEEYRENKLNDLGI
jgi:hypothetical protein